MAAQEIIPGSFRRLADNKIGPISATQTGRESSST
jgi:hypothetical protein